MDWIKNSPNNGDELLEVVAKIKNHKDVFDFYKEAQVRLISLDESTDNARLALEVLSVDEEDDDFDPRESSDHYARMKQLEDSIEKDIQTRKQLASRFEELAGDLLDTPENVEDIDYQFDNIADNETVRSFKHYYKLFCMYRYEFGKRAKDIELSLLHFYKDEYEHLFIYNDVNKNMNEQEPITFTFKLHKYKPFESALKDLDTFQDNVKACMEVYYLIYKSTGNDLMNPDVVRDSQGRMVERGKPSELFKRWERCLLAYDLYTYSKPKLSLAEIGNKAADAIRNTTRKREFNKDVVNAASAAKKDIAEAEKLIASAAKGTFPN